MTLSRCPCPMCLRLHAVRAYASTAVWSVLVFGVGMALGHVAVRLWP